MKRLGDIWRSTEKSQLYQHKALKQRQNSSPASCSLGYFAYPIEDDLGEPLSASTCPTSCGWKIGVVRLKLDFIHRQSGSEAPQLHFDQHNSRDERLHVMGTLRRDCHNSIELIYAVT